ncbi:hypothetical protein L249_7280 [Ophiocordyceps polyrhachis-furcata BCC 54312]|uniref:Fungal lipase-type domain-containing protein n=1 Tax=Ophiocordyceps polyrhachis-furcata BCC 54312 TaxID=1330021 RepID=A0A367L9M7_9HYPO|nr:hypothetical protein L249_7280 [Ophiocordyceps polyrhachis-furcata BCC 54312]
MTKLARSFIRPSPQWLLVLLVLLVLLPLSTSRIPTSLWTDLERLSRIADIAYCVGTSGVRKPFRCLSHCSDFPDLSLATTWHTGMLLSDSCGYIAYDASTSSILVVFRGTYSVANTMVDLSSVPQPYMPYPPSTAPDDEDDNDGRRRRRRRFQCENCTVHTGFYQSWLNARHLVLPEVKTLRELHPSATIHLVGHSLGGAVACLAALELIVSVGFRDVRVTSFGEPRVGNGGMARFVDSVFNLVVEEDHQKGQGEAEDKDEDVKVQEEEEFRKDGSSYRRVTHFQDPVPLLPWDEWGYSSHAGEIFISKAGLSPSEEDLHPCFGDADAECSTALLGRQTGAAAYRSRALLSSSSPISPWPPLFAHRDYFLRLGLCVPGGDPANWARRERQEKQPDEL